MIYKNFDDYWTQGKHGWSSASRDIALATWEDFQDTINATRDDYARMLIGQAVHQEEFMVLRCKAFHAYLDEFKLEQHAGVQFYKYMLDRSSDGSI